MLEDELEELKQELDDDDLDINCSGESQPAKNCTTPSKNHTTRRSLQMHTKLLLVRRRRRRRMMTIFNDKD